MKGMANTDMINGQTPVTDDELFHHGILGQKWGVRRFQNDDGSLTAAGRKRYSTDIKGQKERVRAAQQETKQLKRKVYAETLKHSFTRPKSAENYKKSFDSLNWEKRKLSDEKTKAVLNNSSGKKSKHRLALEQKYIEKGMTPEEAEVAAYKRIRTERAIAIASGTTLAAAAAFVAYKHWDLNADKILKNVELKNISDTDQLDVSRQFFAAYKKRDVNQYLGMYGGDDVVLKGKGVFQSTIGINGNLKVAGRKTAAEMLSKMAAKDPSILAAIKNDMSAYSSEAGMMREKGGELYNRAKKDIDRGKVTKNVYDLINRMQTSGGQFSQVGGRLKSELTKAGYDAILDVNDKKYGGYDTKSPLIVFNGGAKAAVKGVRQIGGTELKEAYDSEKAKWTARQYVKLYAKTYLPQAAEMAAVGAGTAGITKAVAAKKRNRIVADYRKEHPDTKLSYNQIIDNYYKSK